MDDVEKRRPRPVSAEPILNGWRITYDDGTQGNVNEDVYRTMAIRETGKPHGTPGVPVSRTRRL